MAYMVDPSRLSNHECVHVITDHNRSMGLHFIPAQLIYYYLLRGYISWFRRLSVRMKVVWWTHWISWELPCFVKREAVFHRNNQDPTQMCGAVLNHHSSESSSVASLQSQLLVLRQQSIVQNAKPQYLLAGSIQSTFGRWSCWHRSKYSHLLQIRI